MEREPTPLDPHLLTGGVARRLLIGLAALVVLAGAAGALFLNHLRLAVSERERAMLVTARDIDPWLPGLSAINGEEVLSKKKVGGSTEIKYSFEKPAE